MSSFTETENTFEPEGSFAGAPSRLGDAPCITELLQRRRFAPGSQPPRGRLLRLPEVLRLFPVSRSTWYEGIRRGIYPQPVRLSDRVVGWREEDILALIRQRALAA